MEYESNVDVTDGENYGLLVVLRDLPRLEYGFFSDFRSVRLESDVIRWDSFLLRIGLILSNNSVE